MIRRIAIRALLALFLVLLLAVVPRALGAGQTTVSFDTGSKKIFADAARKAALTSGSPRDGDGCVVELGYYSAARVGDKFAGEWVALTGDTSRNVAYQRTSIGDTSANGAASGTVAFSASFVSGSETMGNNLPAVGTPLAVRFYNATTVAAATRFNVASSPSWLWRAPQPAPGDPVLNLSLDDAGVEWLGGTASAFVTSQSTGKLPPPTGAYRALISSAGDGLPQGTLSLRLLGVRGNFSAVIALRGRRYAIRGVLDADGRWQGAIRGAGAPIQVSLAVSADRLSGNLTFADGSISAITGGPLATATVGQPSPQSGAYTLVLERLAGGASGETMVPGFAAMVINARGAARIVGTLPDGAAFSTGAPMLCDDRLLIGVPPSGRGIVGELAFRNQPDISDADGVCAWGGREHRFSRVQVMASKYRPGALLRADDSRATMAGEDQFELTIHGPGVELPRTMAAIGMTSTVPRSRLAPATFQLTSRSGLFRGTFVDPSQRRASFRGVIFQKQRIGEGQFRDRGELVAIELTAVGN